VHTIAKTLLLVLGMAGAGCVFDTSGHPVGDDTGGGEDQLDPLEPEEWPAPPPDAARPEPDAEPDEPDEPDDDEPDGHGGGGRD
jgi:hypothetical protein